MFVRAFRLAAVGTCLVAAPGCGGAKAPEAPVTPNAPPGSETAASRRYMKPELKQAFDKDGKMTWKPGMKIPTPNAGAAPKP